MKITKAELIEMKACEDGLERFINQTGNTGEPVEVLSLIGGENTLPDLVWLASKSLPKERIVRFACDCALINIEEIKPYTDDYDIIVEFLRNPTGGGLVAYAIDDAACAAARVAIYGVAHAAAYAAARAVDVYFDVVQDAVYIHAAHAAHAAGDEEKVNELLKEMFA